MAKPKPVAKQSYLTTHRHSVRHMSLGQRATLAITLEASACKLGNVHPNASFVDMKYDDFLRSAIAIGPTFDQRGKLSVGKLILESVIATQQSVGVNTNLGTLLLMAPVAIAFRTWGNPSSNEAPFPERFAALREKTIHTLDRLTPNDSRDVYAAIRHAAPGGMGNTEKLDVHQAAAPTDLLEAMRVVAEIDQVAHTYCSRFEFLFDEVVPQLQLALKHCGDINHGIRLFQIRWLAQYGDSLVHRKLGKHENDLLRKKSKQLLEIFDAENQQLTEHFEKRWARLDRWMRETGHRRNPGTTADLIAAGLFVLLCCE